MCGIVGFITHKEASSKANTQRMKEAILHRGPDGEGSYSHGNVALAMRRLSIIDVKGGDQPLFNEDKNIVIVGNGEIYNYIELNKKLKPKHRFKTGSDIETIVHLYEEYGPSAAQFLRGMFAFALYDKNKNIILICRDRMGEKPLYWTKTQDGFVFASEMKALLTIRGISKRLSPTAISDYFHYYYVPEPATMFEDIHKLPAASFMILDLDDMSMKQEKYWHPEDIDPTNDEDPTEIISHTFKQSCKLTLRSDVPVGISLSGGVDSGAILAVSAPQYKDTMRAFSIGYEGTPPSDERLMAKKLAKQFKVEFIEKEIKTSEVVDHFPRLVVQGDDPVADIAAHSIYSVSKLSRDSGVPVMLGGLGGDELFWGYPWTQKAMLDTHRHIAKLKKMSKVERAVRTLISKPIQNDHLYFYDQNPGFTAANQFIEPLLSTQFKMHRILPPSRYMEFDLSGPKLQINKKGLQLIRDIWLQSNCIVLGDRLSMASSIELRSPFLDFKLIEATLNSKKVVSAVDKPPKYWFKKAMKGILPNEVLDRPKRGFTPPVGDWLRGIFTKHLHLTRGGFLETENIVDRKKMAVVRATWQTIPMYWYCLYQLVLLEIWGRAYYYDQALVTEK